MSEPFTRVPNALIERWLVELSPAEFKVGMFLVRWTLGFHRKAFETGMRRIAAGTGLVLETVHSAIRSLKERGEISSTRGFRNRHTYTLQCSEIPNTLNGVECSEKQNAECSERPNSSVRKFLTGERNHHQRNKIKKNTGTPKPVSEKNVDDEPPAPRAQLQNAEAEFRLRLCERNTPPARIDAIVEDVKQTLSRGDATLGDFLEKDAEKTTAPDSLTNHGGYYHGLARGLGKHKATEAVLEALEATAELSAAIAAGNRPQPQKCPNCKDGALLTGGYCNCRTGEARRELDAMRALAARRIEARA